MNLEKSEKRPFVVGLNAPQGAGKTTLSRFLVENFNSLGFNAITMSIDDFYLTNNDQQKLAKATNNKYLQQRGYPGTHDIDLGEKTFESLLSGQNTLIPRYDKSCFNGKGDRASKEQWLQVNHPQEIIIFEGWCLGFLPFDQHEDSTLNEINENLKQYHRWVSFLEMFIYLKPQEIHWVRDWRVEAEQKMRNSGRGGMTDCEVIDYVNNFIPAYEVYRETPSSLKESVSDYIEVIIGKDRLPIEGSRS